MRSWSEARPPSRQSVAHLSSAGAGRESPTRIVLCGDSLIPLTHNLVTTAAEIPTMFIVGATSWKTAPPTKMLACRSGKPVRSDGVSILAPRSALVGVITRLMVEGGGRLICRRKILSTVCGSGPRP